MCLSSLWSSGFLGHVAQDEWMAGAQEDKWKHMMPFESFIVGLACYHVYITLDNTSHMAKPSVNNVGKCTLSIIVGVTIKSSGKGNGYINLILGGHEKLRMTIYYTTVHSFVYFLYPYHMQNKFLHKTRKVSSIYDTWDLILSLNLVPCDWGIVNLKTNYFPLIIWHAVTSTLIQKGDEEKVHVCCWFIAIFTSYGQVLPGPFPGSRAFSIISLSFTPWEQVPFYCSRWLLTLLTGRFFIITVLSHFWSRH